MSNFCLFIVKLGQKVFKRIGETQYKRGKLSFASKMES